jgi:hypothetical protein
MPPPLPLLFFTQYILSSPKLISTAPDSLLNPISMALQRTPSLFCHPAPDIQVPPLSKPSTYTLKEVEARGERDYTSILVSALTIAGQYCICFVV